MTPQTLKRLEELNDRWANEPDNCPGTIAADCIACEVMDHLPDLIVAVKERDAALKACAEMRNVLSFLNDTALDEVKAHGCCQCDVENGDNPCGYCATVNSAAEIQHALSTDCGKGYHHDRDCEPLREALRFAKLGLESFPRQSALDAIRERLREALAHWEKVRGK